jgi:outer membrane lipoprotein LolB
LKIFQWAVFIAGLAGGFFLAGCSSVPDTKPDQAGRSLLYEARLNDLSRAEQWAFEGRLAVNDGKDGGSGYLEWTNHGDSTSMNFHGALGRGAWRLETDDDGAVLELADGEVHRAASVSQLVESRLGWEFPVDALAWWVRACAAPGDWDRRELDDNGRLSTLSQFGWLIEYGNYRDIGGVYMPLKLTARRDAYAVKLAMRNWSVMMDSDRNE